MMGGVGGDGQASPGIWGLMTFCPGRGAMCGVVVRAGAPLPTEIRLISQELPKNEDVHPSVLSGCFGSMCVVTQVCGKHLLQISCKCREQNLDAAPN